MEPTAKSIYEQCEGEGGMLEYQQHEERCAQEARHESQIREFEMCEKHGRAKENMTLLQLLGQAEFELKAFRGSSLNTLLSRPCLDI